MMRTTETVIALYYNLSPNEQELLCICESEAVAHEEIHRLIEEFSDVYTLIKNFELRPVLYIRRK
jgi:hypothetical protein